MGIWDSITAPFTGKPIEQAAAAKAAALQQGMAQQSQLYGQGRDALTNQYTAALQPYQALQPAAMGGYQAYADISGAAGQEGQARAASMFQTDPGYQWALQEKLKAAQAAGAAGGVAIGNTADLSSRIAGQAANEQYGNYVNRLAPWLQQGQQTAAGLGNIYTGLGNQLGQSFTGQGNAVMAGMAGIGNAQGEGLMAPMAAGSNIWSGALNLGKGIAGMGGFGGMFGQGGMFGAPNPYPQQSSPLIS